MILQSAWVYTGCDLLATFVATLHIILFVNTRHDWMHSHTSRSTLDILDTLKSTPSSLPARYSNNCPSTSTIAIWFRDPFYQTTITCNDICSLYELHSFDTTIRFLQSHIVSWRHRNKNLKRLVSYHHSNPNNVHKSTCKNIEVDIGILMVQEAYITLDL